MSVNFSRLIDWRSGDGYNGYLLFERTKLCREQLSRHGVISNEIVEYDSTTTAQIPPSQVSHALATALFDTVSVQHPRNVTRKSLHIDVSGLNVESDS